MTGVSFVVKKGVDAVETSAVTWTSTSTNTLSKKSRRTRATAPIFISIFDKCASLTRDAYWKEVFEEASQGRLPSKFSFVDGCIRYKHGQRVVTQPLSLDPSIALLEAVHFFQTYGGHYSEEDRRQHFIDVISAEEETDGDCWSDLKKKYKENVLYNFIESETLRRNLSRSEVDQLLKVLKLGLSLKYFHKGNIVVEKFSIKRIEGLDFDPVRRLYSISKAIKRVETRTSRTKKAVVRKDKWAAHFTPSNEAYTSGNFIILEPTRSGSGSSSEHTSETPSFKLIFNL